MDADAQIKALVETNYYLRVENAAYRKWIKSLCDQGIIERDQVTGQVATMGAPQVDTYYMEQLAQKDRIIQELRKSGEANDDHLSRAKELIREEYDTQVITLRENLAKAEARCSQLSHAKDEAVASAREAVQDTRDALHQECASLRRELVETQAKVDTIRLETQVSMQKHIDAARAETRDECTTLEKARSATMARELKEAVAIATTLRVENARLSAKDTTGKTGECAVREQLKASGLFDNVKDCSMDGENTDIEVTLGGKKCLVEVKTYTGAVSTKMVNTFLHVIRERKPAVAAMVATAGIAKVRGMEITQVGPTTVIYIPTWGSMASSAIGAIWSAMRAGGDSSGYGRYTKQIREAYVMDKTRCEKQIRSLRDHVRELDRRIDDLNT